MRKIANYGDIDRQEEQFKVLVKLFSELKNAREAEALLQTLLTKSEKAVISQRLAILRMVHKSFKYSDIEEKLKVSPSTITKAIDNYYKNSQLNNLFDQQIEKFRFDDKKEVKIAYPNRGKIEKFSPSLRQLRRESNQTPKDHNYS